MHARRTLLFTWFVTGGGALAGSILGGLLGNAALFIGGVIGGAGAVVMAVVVMVRFGWVAREVRLGAIIGGVIGFAIAAMLAVTNLRSPIVPILSSALSGVGVLLGAGFARKTGA